MQYQRCPMSDEQWKRVYSNNETYTDLRKKETDRQTDRQRDRDREETLNNYNHLSLPGWEG